MSVRTMVRSLLERLTEQIAKGETPPERPPIVPTVPPAKPDLDSLARTVNALKSAVDQINGVTGSLMDKPVSLRDLVDCGVVQVTVGDQVYAPPSGFGGADAGAVPGTVSVVGSDSDPRPVLDTPPAPTDLSVGGALKNIILTWSLLEYRNHSYVEVFRHTADNQALATKIGTSTSNLYADTTAVMGQTYYYWVRAVGFSMSDGSPITGPFNAVAGTAGGLAQVGSVDLSDLVVTTDKLAPDAVTAAKIAADAVTAGKIAAGAVNADAIAANAVVAGKIAAGALVAGDGVMGNLYVDTAKIADGAVITAKIADASITEAKIANAAITNAKIANAAITTAKIANAAITTAEIADAAITTAKIADATITGAKIGTATIQSANIANLEGSKIVASSIDASRITVNGISGAFEAAASSLSSLNTTFTTLLSISIPSADEASKFVLAVMGTASVAYVFTPGMSRIHLAVEEASGTAKGNWVGGAFLGPMSAYAAAYASSSSPEFNIPISLHAMWKPATGIGAHSLTFNLVGKRDSSPNIDMLSNVRFSILEIRR